MIQLGLVTDPIFKKHDTGFGHPERPARLDAVTAALEWSGLLTIARRITPEPVERALLESLHDPAYIERIETRCRAGRAYIDTPDSAICTETFEVALLAAGAVVKAARLIAGGEIRRAFCAVRPPGHHAERDASMGFCFFGNVALAAQAVRRDFGIQRVLILDWDVHHGNGTQHLFEADPGVLFISLHGHPDHLYPGTGYEHEIGTGPGTGYTINVPFAPRTGDAEYQAAFEEKVLPAVAKFEPEFVMLSAGFDAHQDDPLGSLSLSDEAFVWMLQRMIEVAERHARGRLLSVLEGGYNLDVLKRCVGEHVGILSGG